eukprot:Amastigsp_a686400_24.p4 type:complete len:112 gc:universal Amastigsp_a686400_24:351-16(-)
MTFPMGECAAVSSVSLTFFGIDAILSPFFTACVSTSPRWVFESRRGRTSGAVMPCAVRVSTNAFQSGSTSSASEPGRARACVLSELAALQSASTTVMPTRSSSGVARVVMK